MAVPRVHPKTLETMARGGGGAGLGGGQFIPHFLMMRDSRILPLAQQLWEESGEDPDKFVYVVYEYITRNVGYAFDSDYYGLTEYIAMPYQTLSEGFGDCECTSIAMVAILTSKGIPCREVLGYAGGGSHRWPEVKVGEKWFVFDTTNGDVFPIECSERKGYISLFYVTPHSFRPTWCPIPLFLP